MSKKMVVGSYKFLGGGGETGQRIRSFDWSKTSVGPVNTWPQSLRTILGVVLNSRLPMILYWGPDLIQFYNDAYQSFCNKGKPSAELGQKGGASLSEAWPAIKKIIDQVRSGGDVVLDGNKPFQVHRKGERRDVYWTLHYSHVYDESGNVGGVLAVGNESTQTVKALDKLKKQFKFLADEARDPFVLMREDGTFAYLNKKALETWQYKAEEARHLRVPDVDPVYQEEAFLDLFAKAQKENVPQFETLHKTKGGHTFPVEANVVGIRIDGNPYLFAVIRDITLRKQAEEALKENLGHLEKVNQDLDSFIYVASHDLKAPISNIEGLVDVLKLNLGNEIPASETLEQTIAMIEDSVARFKRTIANLAEVVKLQKEDVGEPVMVNVSEVVREVCLDLDQLIQHSGAKIETDLAGCPEIYFSKKNLRSVVYNLLSNSIKYRSPSRAPMIQVCCKSIPDYHVLSVSDNGMGMEKGQTARLFTMFQRFHFHVEGTGIGLYLIKRMVDNAGGNIKVESRQGEGTTFHVYFRRYNK